MPRRGLTSCGNGPRWWHHGVVSMSVIFLAITPSSSEFSFLPDLHAEAKKGVEKAVFLLHS